MLIVSLHVSVTFSLLRDALLFSKFFFSLFLFRKRKLYSVAARAVVVVVVVPVLIRMHTLTEAHTYLSAFASRMKMFFLIESTKFERENVLLFL